MFFLALYLSCLAVRICSCGLFACHFACHKLYAVFLWLYYIVVFYTFCVFLFKIFYICQLCIIVYGLAALLLLTCFWITSSSWLPIQVMVVTLSYVFIIIFFLPFYLCSVLQFASLFSLFRFIHIFYRSITPAVLLELVAFFSPPPSKVSQVTSRSPGTFRLSGFQIIRLTVFNTV